jgi:hypothetical protein
MAGGRLTEVANVTSLTVLSWEVKKRHFAMGAHLGPENLSPTGEQGSSLWSVLLTQLIKE